MQSSGDTTQMEEAFAEAGIEKEETPQKAAERIWKETKKNPIETMKKFEEWARQKPDRILQILGVYWLRHVRSFLERNQKSDGAWRYSDSFRVLLRKAERAEHNYKSEELRKKRRKALNSVEAIKGRRITNEASRQTYYRKRDGIKRISADVDIRTGQILSIIDREYGPFAHIRINGCHLAEVTTEQALRYCDDKSRDVKFIRALCQLIPDPRKPIGEQWTAEMIRESKKAAG